KPFADGTRTFEEEIKRLGIPSNFGDMTTEDEALLKEAVKKSIWYYCDCESCGKLAKVWKRTPPKGSLQKIPRYRSGCCRSKLVYKGGEDAQVVVARVLKHNADSKAKRG
ncbi:hypothetical protein, partial [Bacillus mycoides]|uniref:hypothetical protein n=1 Tax=Bacillus mycoides TaxID=1405 RepID=UPI003A7FB5F3